MTVSDRAGILNQSLDKIVIAVAMRDHRRAKELLDEFLDDAAEFDSAVMEAISGK